LHVYYINNIYNGQDEVKRNERLKYFFAGANEAYLLQVDSVLATSTGNTTSTYLQGEDKLRYQTNIWLKPV